eukprot:g15874.t1
MTPMRRWARRGALKPSKSRRHGFRELAKKKILMEHTDSRGRQRLQAALVAPAKVLSRVKNENGPGWLHPSAVALVEGMEVARVDDMKHGRTNNPRERWFNLLPDSCGTSDRRQPQR